VEGMQYDRGYISPYMATDIEKMEAVLKDPYILLTDQKVSNVQDFIPLLEEVMRSGRPLFLVAEDVDGEALATLLLNKLRGTLNVVAIKAPGFGDRRKRILEDIAVVTGAQVIDKDFGMTMADATMEMLGTAKTVKVTKDTALIVDGAGKADDIKARVKAAMAGAADEAEFKSRLAAAGVTYETKDSKKYGRYYVYDLDKATLPEGVSVPGRERLKARSYKLGADYGPDAVQAAVEAARKAKAASGKPGGAQAGGRGKDQDEARERARRQAEACRKDAEEAAREFKSFDAALEAMKRLGSTIDAVERYKRELEDDDEDGVTRK